jgi:hypothetical protein
MNYVQILKSLTEIKREARIGDSRRVAYICGCSEETVKSVLSGRRKDYYNVRLAYTKLFQQRIILEISLRQEFHSLNNISNKA